MTIALGLMSGTSCDGVSVAAVDFRGRAYRLLAYKTFLYVPALATRLRNARELRTPELARLTMQLGEQFASASQRLLAFAELRVDRIAVIGSHGHTVYHGPQDATACTLQLGAPAVIAQRTGIPVVADFRPRDVAAGGQGAPLIPFFDDYFFGTGAARALQNIGGIGNVAVIGRGVKPIAFDTGPGNTLLDAAMRRISRGRASCDRQGRLAAKGHVDSRALARLQAHPFFHTPPPKSTGPERFNESLLDRAFGSGWTARGPDVLATVTYLTAWSIADSYRRFVRVPLREVIVNGGGCFNRTLMSHLADLLRPVPVVSIERYGLPPQAKEPVAFAFLALRALQGRINHLPETTGAAEACILGSLSFAQPRRRSLIVVRKSVRRSVGQALKSPEQRSQIDGATGNHERRTTNDEPSRR